MQLALSFSHPEEHFRQLHSETVGTVIVWNKLGLRGKRWVKIKPGDDPAAALMQYQGKDDCFVSVSQFNHWRLISNLKALQAVYVDIDGTEDVMGVLDCLADNNMPAPSFIVESGRGLHCYWLHNAKPHQALPVWQLMQNALCETLAPLGADPLAKDCARVLRLVGSVNSKNRKVVRGIEITGERWEFHLLANEVLGYRPAPPAAKVKSITTARAKRGEPVPSYARKSIKSREYLVFRDILTVCERLQAQGGVPAGSRDLVLFHLARALSWYAEPGTLEAEIVALARRWTPSFSEQEALTYTKPVRDRAAAAAEGKKIVWAGQERDPRYYYKRQTLYREFAPLVGQAGCARELRAIISDDLARERNAERQRKIRETKGAVSRAEYLAKAENHRQQAVALKNQGFKAAKIAEELGVSRQHVYKLLKSVASPSPYIAPAGSGAAASSKSVASPSPYSDDLFG